MVPVKLMFISETVLSVTNCYVWYSTSFKRDIPFPGILPYHVTTVSTNESLTILISDLNSSDRVTEELKIAITLSNLNIYSFAFENTYLSQ